MEADFSICQGFPGSSLMSGPDKSKSYKAVHLNHVFRGTPLAVQWLRILLPMQGTQAQSLVQDDPTRQEANKPASHNS